ncbi:hypothetical protein CQW23_34972 [Capsicum baccatum]|uniref:Protein TAR1 n=1 Tax=Capsicum baccatum TaxID=33114 RepID=A0A2G2UXP3_CAPBA|nr:hypothetical protein CQW23_34972 [Capsicum baccatum]
MVHRILQFTPSITFHNVLHRCESRDIHCRVSFSFIEEAQVLPTHAADGARGAGYRFKYSLALSAMGFVGRPSARAPGMGGGARAECRSTPLARTPQLLTTFAESFYCAGFDNDPSAGSLMETLLRLLLPLNDKVQWTSRDVVGSESPTSTRSEHFTRSFNRYAHTRTLLRRSRLVGGAPLGGIAPISFVVPYGFTRPLTHTHVKLLGPCCKTGRMGSPQASVRSAQMPKHAGGARCLPQSRRRHSMSVSRARALAAPPIHAGPRPGSIGVPAYCRSTYDRGASPADNDQSTTLVGV